MPNRSTVKMDRVASSADLYHEWAGSVREEPYSLALTSGLCTSLERRLMTARPYERPQDIGPGRRRLSVAKRVQTRSYDLPNQLARPDTDTRPKTPWRGSSHMHSIRYLRCTLYLYIKLNCAYAPSCIMHNSLPALSLLRLLLPWVYSATAL